MKFGLQVLEAREPFVRIFKQLIASGVMLTLPSVAIAQDPEAGKNVFEQQCSACHEIGPGAKNNVGPDLNGVIGRKAGTEAGYDCHEESRLGMERGDLQGIRRRPEEEVARDQDAVPRHQGRAQS